MMKSKLVIFLLLILGFSTKAQDQFLGEIRIFAGSFAPKGWAFCQGQILPISQNTALFSLLGTTYGGDGRSTFALPNLQGRMIIGPGQGPGLTLYDLGETGGEATITLTVAEIAAHYHTFTFPVTALVCMAATGTLDTPANGYPANTPGGYSNSANTSMKSVSNGVTIQSSGGSSPHNNMQPYVVLNYIIATQGIFPARP
jgi:microcystin-dependent protein